MNDHYHFVFVGYSATKVQSFAFKLENTVGIRLQKRRVVN